MLGAMWNFRRLLLLVALTATCAQAAEERWIKVTAGQFTILTAASERPARKWAAELERFHRGLQGAVPVPLERLRPVTVVLFKNDRAMEPYVPLENGRPAKMGGLFVRIDDLNVIMLSLTRDAQETRHVVLHEAVHWHLAARGERWPLWLDEGLAELYATFEFPDAERERLGAPLAGHLRQLRTGKFIPLTQLIATDRSSLLYNESARGNIFYAQSWALAHLLFFGDQASGAANLERYLARLKTGGPAGDSFASVFGSDLAALEQRLRGYAPVSVERKSTVARAAVPEAELVIADAGRIEVELAKGALLLGARGPAAAERQLIAATELAPRDARAWELLGISTSLAATAASSPKAMDAAVAHFRRALDLDPTRVAAYEGIAGLAYSTESFSPELTELLRRGLVLAPGNPMIEVGLASAELRSGRRAAGQAQLERLVALDPTGAQPATKLARQVLEDDQLKADFAAVEALARESRYADLIVVLDRALARELAPASRQRVSELRGRMGDFKTVFDAIARVNRGDAMGANALLVELMATNPEKAVADTARQVLDRIARETPAARP